MQHNLIYYPNKILQHKAVSVNSFDKELEYLLQDMKHVMKKSKGVGIAAPQVGVSMRCFHVLYNKAVYTFVNPTIQSYSSTTSQYEEGCLSIPGVYANVTRPDALTIEAFDKKGKVFSMDVDGFFARVIQHEFDHLEGVLFIDRISSSARGLALKSYQSLESDIYEK